jgi:hypothetical protein
MLVTSASRFSPGEEPWEGLAGFDGKLVLNVGNEVVEMRLDTVSRPTERDSS